MLKLFYVILVFLSTLILSCNNQSESKALSAEDISKIKQLNQAYVTGWLSNDSAAVLNLFMDNATIIPSGMNPKKGRKELKEFWFPDDSSETIIHKYELDILDLQGANDLAFTLEKGFLSFSYQKEALKISKESHSHASTVYIRQNNGNWKIYSRMWTDIR